jgi:hypothetical protein
LLDFIVADETDCKTSVVFKNEISSVFENEISATFESEISSALESEISVVLESKISNGSYKNSSSIVVEDDG